ncbi:MAG: hypothetical protein KA604_00110 [Candidatus Saccharimonas sp.]|nr:hypothetical protein [Candidatus Saccharimonas sp.]
MSGEQDATSERIEVRVANNASAQADEKLLEAPDVEDSLPEHTNASDALPNSQPSVDVLAVQQPLQANEAVAKQPVSSGVAVLQWLAYAFWFWFAIATTWLAGVVINFFVAGSQTSEWGSVVAYPLATVIIVLLIAFVTDFFYAKYEPAKKSGASYVIMLLHVVPFVLTAICGLVVMVFATINMILNSDPVLGSNGPMQVLLTALVTTVLFSVLSARVFFGGVKATIRKSAWGLFIVVALCSVIAAIAGPAAEANRTKQDRLIEAALPSLAGDIRDYAVKYDKLPATIGDVTHESTTSSSYVQKALDQKLITYKPNTLPASTGNNYNPGDDTGDGIEPMPANVKSLMYDDNAKTFYYQLCTTYTAEKKSSYNYTESRGVEYTTNMSAGVTADYRYDSLYSISSHPKGTVCYNLYATGKYTYQY